MNGWLLIAILLGVAVLVFSGVYYYRRRQFQELPSEVQDAVTAARDARKKWQEAQKAQSRAEKAALKTLNELRDPKGRRLANGGGVTLYQRWIDTPQGGGSIIGVNASAADESNVRQRLTATRLLAFGVFALAAPKKTTGGNAYVVIEGPAVAGVATFSARGDENAGPKAYELAAKITNAARAAEVEKTTLPKKIAAAENTYKRSQDKSQVEIAYSRFKRLLAAVPAENRAKYFAADVAKDSSCAVDPHRGPAEERQHRTEAMGVENASLLESAVAAVRQIAASEAAREGWLGEVDFSADISAIAANFEKADGLRKVADKLTALDNPDGNDRKLLAEAKNTIAKLELPAIERVELVTKCALEATLIDKSLQKERKDARTAEQRAKLHAELSAMIYGIEANPSATPSSAAADAVLARVEAYRELSEQIKRAREAPEPQ